MTKCLTCGQTQRDCICLGSETPIAPTGGEIERTGVKECLTTGVGKDGLRTGWKFKIGDAAFTVDNPGLAIAIAAAHHAALRAEKAKSEGLEESLRRIAERHDRAIRQVGELSENLTSANRACDRIAKNYDTALARIQALEKCLGWIKSTVESTGPDEDYWRNECVTASTRCHIVSEIEAALQPTEESAK